MPALLAIVLAILWAMPAVFFPAPAFNEDIDLSALGPLTYLFTLVVSVVLAVIGVVRLGWSTDGSVGLGIFLLGLVPAFVVGIAVFGNFSNDRFTALFLTPALALPGGIAALVAGLSLKSRSRATPLRGAIGGAVAALVIASWLRLRGPTDWLQAPYGFDIFLLIGVAAASMLYLGASVRTERNPKANHP